MPAQGPEHLDQGGNAILIATNNVTIDCNGFKLGGLLAGPGTETIGIATYDHFNVSVRNCNVRGFRWGILLAATDVASGGGHVVEDNRLDASTFVGMAVQGDGSVARRNQVLDTGGSPLGFAIGILTKGAVDVLDNSVSGVFSTAGSNSDATGISTDLGTGSSVNGNRVRGLTPEGTGREFGIFQGNSFRTQLRGNFVSGHGVANSEGIGCHGDTGSSVKDNVITGFPTAILECVDSGGNSVLPP